MLAGMTEPPMREPTVGDASPGPGSEFVIRLPLHASQDGTRALAGKSGATAPRAVA